MCAKKGPENGPRFVEAANGSGGQRLADFLDMAVVSREVPLLGKVKSGAALPFDIGVAAIVVGLGTAVLEGLGGDVDEPDDRDDPS